MVDRIGRRPPRFPQAHAEKIGQRIARELEALQATDGFASATSGGDILFLEAVLTRGGRVHVTLPCAVDEFRHDCVDIIPGADWAARFDRILQQATSLEVLSQQYASDNAMASECCNRVMVGLAVRNAAAKGEEPHVLALWDGRPGDAFGGTQSVVQFCSQYGFRVRWMSDLVPGGGAESRNLAPAVNTSAVRHATFVAEAPQQICTAVFADAVGFSKLREREVPLFARHYLTSAMSALQARTIVPLVKNTWGDGLYLVFESVRDAGVFALDFRDRIVSTDWRQLGLSAALNVRIGIHAGPLYRIYDPVIGQWSYTGAHVTRAARLEPSTDPGKVFATLPFVALAAAERATEFLCRPAGRRELAKGAGAIELFELTRDGLQTS
jgi:class 3 adenylate cyclase